MTDFIEQRSPEWFEARRNRLTGSMVGGVLNLSPYMSRADVMRAMVREREGLESEFKGNPATAWGEYNEDGARQDFMLETGLQCRPATFIAYEDWLGASPDNYTSDDGLLEIKCPFGLRHKTAPVPFKSIAEMPHYYAQMQCQMLVTGKRHVHFFQWTPAETKRERVIWDQFWIDENLPKLRQFYAEYLDESPELHVAPKRAIVDSPAAFAMIEEWDEISVALDNLNARKKDLLEEMVAMAGDKNSLFGGRNLTLTKRKGSISYAKAMKSLLPNADLTPFTGEAVEYWGVK